MADIPDSRRYIASILEPYCTIVEARDGRDALEKFSARAPDLVIADAVLPIVRYIRWWNSRGRR